MGGVCGNCGTGVVGGWGAGRIAREGALQSGPYGWGVVGEWRVESRMESGEWRVKSGE